MTRGASAVDGGDTLTGGWMARWIGVVTTVIAVGIGSAVADDRHNSRLGYNLDFASLPLENGTIEFWFRPGFSTGEQLDDSYRIIAPMFFLIGDYGDADSEQGGRQMNVVHYTTGSKGMLGVTFSPRPEGVDWWATTAEFMQDEWHHFAFTWSGNYCQVYLDGEWIMDREVTSLQEYFASNAVVQLSLGGLSKYPTLPMVYDDLRVSNIARDPKELGFTVGKLEPDEATVVLDSLDDLGPASTTAAVHAGQEGAPGGLLKGAAISVEGRFGEAVLLKRE